MFKIEFPIDHAEIPKHVRELRAFIDQRKMEIELASKMLKMVREGCKHENAEHGWNERDGSWMNPCPHCGHSY